MDNHGLNPADTAMARADPAAGRRARVGRRPERDRRGPHADQRDLGARLGDRPGRGRARPHRARAARASCATIEAGRKDHRDTCGHGGRRRRRCRRSWRASPASTPGQAMTLGRLLRKCEDAARHAGRDRMGARRGGLQAAAGAAAACAGDAWCRTRSGCSIPSFSGHPAGIGWGSGRAVVVNCECELSRVAPGDVLVTQVAGPALSHILPQRRRRGGRARRLDLASRLARARARHSRWCSACSTPRGTSRMARRSRSTALPASCGGCADAAKARPHLRHPAGRRQRDRAAARGRQRQGQSRTPAASSQRRR